MPLRKTLSYPHVRGRLNSETSIEKEGRKPENVYGLPLTGGREGGLSVTWLTLGRTVMESAARELREETGLTLVQVNDILGESFSAIGFSNEKNVCVVGVAEGEFAPSTSTVEEIEAQWYTKSEVRKLLKEEYFAARTQSYCYLWSKE